MELMERLIGEWQAARAELAAIERAEHPDITDRYGRTWVWRDGDLYSHDATLAFPRDFLDRVGLPSPRLADNPNYSRLCARCRSEWPGPVQLELDLGQAAALR